MTKLPICRLCLKRKVPQDEWKTPEEKEFCFTCYTFKKTCDLTIESLQLLAHTKNINRRVVMILTNFKLNPEQKLLESMGYRTGVIIKDDPVK